MHRSLAATLIGGAAISTDLIVRSQPADDTAGLDEYRAAFIHELRKTRAHQNLRKLRCDLSVVRQQNP
jgi:hypothetical protein